MRLVGAVTQGSGPVNEDGWGFAGSEGDTRAVWVFDGVTGINGRNILGEGTDAAWLVARAQARLAELAALDISLPAILDRLVDGLCADWGRVVSSVTILDDYDPPAACLILAKRYDDGWRALRLGDSCLLARGDDGNLLTALPDNSFDHWIAAEAQARRAAGVLDVRKLLDEFRPQLMASRQRRNAVGGYGILEANPAAKNFAEFMKIGFPRELLICTDGFYRAVDHYGLHTTDTLVEACAESDGVSRVLAGTRAVEMADPLCQRFPRLKPADDATAVMLGNFT